MTLILATASFALSIVLGLALVNALVRLDRMKARLEVAHTDLYQQSQRLHTLSLETRDLDRRCASNNAAYEMLEPLVDNHERLAEAQAGLHILHAEAITRVQTQVDEMKRRPFFTPATTGFRS